MADILENLLKSGYSILLRYPGGVENFDEIALSPTVKEIAKNLRFRILAKNSKNQDGRRFGKFVEKWV